MTEQLKTLKDMFTSPYDGECSCGACGESFPCDIDKIRQEAIKWIKEFRTNITDFDREINEKLVCCEHTTPFLIEWIKHFFNITESEIQ